MAKDAVVRAIDVGVWNTKLVIGGDSQSISCMHFPSITPVSDEVGVTDALGTRRKTVAIPIGGLMYEVGPEAHLAAGIFNARQMHDGCCETREYLALVRGARHYMKVDRIDLLVLGLPVATFKIKKAALERRMTGTHELGRASASR